MPTPRDRNELRKRPTPPAPTGVGGRHRRRSGATRPLVLSLLAVLTLLLGSGTAISLTAGAGTAPPPDDPPTVALGSAPTADTRHATAPPAPPASATAPATSPNADPDPAESRGEERGDGSGPSGDASSGGDANEGSDGGSGDGQTDEVTALEDEVTRLTNAERRDAGCDAVTTDERLRDAARGHSADMAANDYFDHTGLDGSSPSDRMRAAGYPDPAGENIAYGYRTPAEVMAGWMGSDGHRRNLLNCSHRAIGVGLAYDGDGRPYWTQVFGR